jgi:hypothetical protein
MHCQNSKKQIWRLGLFDLPGLGREGDGMIELMTEAFVSHLEEFLQAGRAASLKNKRLVRGRLVIDGTGLGLGTLRLLHIVKKITGLGKVKRNAAWLVGRLVCGWSVGWLVPLVERLRVLFTSAVFYLSSSRKS